MQDKKILLIVDVAKCVGCYNCLMACKDEHVGNSWLPYTDEQQKHEEKWIDPIRFESGKAPYTEVCFVTELCQHCSDAPCAGAAPGLIKSREDGIVLIDALEAHRTDELISACPYGQIKLNAEKGLAQKCTMCAHLLDDAWAEPRCVQACPLRALTLVKVTDEEYDRIKEDQALEELYPGAVRPRVLYKNLSRKTSVFIAGSLSYEETLEASGATVDTAAAGVLVTLSINGVKLAETETDFLGEYKFHHIPKGSGEFELAYSLEGFKAARDKVIIEDESVCAKHVVLKRKQ